MPPEQITGLSLVAGLAIIRAIYDVADISTQSKWPNDVLYDSRKIAGILVELAADHSKVEYMIVGCGINVNHQKKDFPSSLQKKSTSLRIVCGREISRITLLQRALQQFENLYTNFCKYGFNYLSKELIDNSSIIGKNITTEIKAWRCLSPGYPNPTHRFKAAV